MSKFTRRQALGVAAGGIVAKGALDAAERTEDAKDKLPPFRASLIGQKARVLPGGTAREAGVAQFPVAKSIAGVLMTLKPGGLRELHWHANAAEWAYMIQGHARTTVYDPQGREETNDFGPGDVWYFPRGHGHSIQGLGPDGCEFLLVFDNGYFSEFATFSLTDWLAHTPRAIVAKNLGVPADDLKTLPDREVYIVQGAVPPALPADPPAGSQKSPPLTHKYQLLAQAPQRYKGSTIRIVSAREFPISKTITGALFDLEPGALRELHWHPNADEWQYVVTGKARLTVFASSGLASVAGLAAGDVGFVPMGYGHSIENSGDGPMRMIIAFNSGEYQEISLTGWLAANPPLLVETNLNLPAAVVARFPRKESFITGGEARK